MTRASKIHIVQTPPLAVDRTTAAAALGVSESTLEGLVRSGDLPPPRRHCPRAERGAAWKPTQEPALSQAGALPEFGLAERQGSLDLLAAP